MNIKEADIVRMTGEAGGFDATPVFLKRFAKLVVANIDPKSFMTWHEGHEVGAAHEREECAKMVDHILKEGGGTYGDAIRARNKA